MQEDAGSIPALYKHLCAGTTKTCATCFSSCYDKDSATIFTTGRLHDVTPP
jgi:hypothetical protein